MTDASPAKRPCGSCPYRRDVPSGIWSPEEYEKLPTYDAPTAEQPPSVFLCHQQDGRVCAGWAGCHDMDQSLGVRIGAAMGALTLDEVETVLTYRTDVALFASGAEAAEHGRRDLARPGRRAVRMMGRLERKLGPNPTA